MTLAAVEAAAPVLADIPARLTATSEVMQAFLREATAAAIVRFR